MGRKKTAVEKRDTTPAPRIEVLAEPLGPSYPAGRMLIASPLAVQAQVRTIPEGNFMTIGQLRENLALLYGADYTCPLTTSIFLRIVAEATEEEHRTDVPYWRVVRNDGSFFEKHPGGLAAQQAKLAAEGLPLVTKRGKTKLDFQALAEL